MTASLSQSSVHENWMGANIIASCLHNITCLCLCLASTEPCSYWISCTAVTNYIVCSVPDKDFLSVSSEINICWLQWCAPSWSGVELFYCSSFNRLPTFCSDVESLRALRVTYAWQSSNTWRLTPGTSLNYWSLCDNSHKGFEHSSYTGWWSHLEGYIAWNTMTDVKLIYRLRPAEFVSGS